jgi:CDP-diacylglycerol--glycerol-3-phosphate 3-phosphatidyltransferase
MTLPNQLTVARVVAVPIVCLFVASGYDWVRWVGLVLFILAALSDWLDGFLARRMHLNSAFGRMLDPIADKLLVGALIVTLAWTRDLTGFDLIAAIAIMMREIFISGLREYLGAHNVTVPVTMLAKWKTTAQLVALALLIAAPLLLGLMGVAHFVFWIAAALTVWTGWEYLRSSWPDLAGPEL